MEKKPNILQFSEEDFAVIAQKLDLKKFRIQQILEWLYAKGEFDLKNMTNLPLSLREKLEADYALTPIKEVYSQESKDKTIKVLYELASGNHIETVLIPELKRHGTTKRMTVCVSSQVGCAMGCVFCATGKLGFIQNLSASEIYQQVFQMNRLSLEKFGSKVTNIVFMGMGEPLQNYQVVLESISMLTNPKFLGLSPRRITVSTVGLARRIKELADDGAKFRLAVSLHAPFQDKRSSIMPVNRRDKTDLQALKDSIQYYYEKTKQKITYEYCIFEKFNDNEEDALALAKVVNWAPSKVNIIMYNRVEGVPFRSTSEQRLNHFIQTLVKRNVTVTVRRSRGQDIDAACGQLALAKQ